MKKPDEDAYEIVTFSAGTQEFGIDINSVREIRGWSEETIIPQSPDYVRGFINLRGTVVPIVDLATRLEMVATEPTPRSVIIVLHMEEQFIGLLVDTVRDILVVNPAEFQPTPNVASEFAKMFIRGVVPSEHGMLCMLETENILPIEMAQAA